MRYLLLIPAIVVVGVLTLTAFAEFVETLERHMEACCETELGLSTQDGLGSEAYVALKARVAGLEKRLLELEEAQ